ncbi:MAG TPA: HD domain-containing protein [Clostridiales bacterium]|nr:HD domain-containing protein [Clostridiales bacterium]
MTEKYINEFAAGEIVQNFFLIKTAECRVSNNSKKYLDITLVDKTGEINAKLWDCNDSDEGMYIRNTLVKIRGNIVEWQGNMQLKIDKIRLVKKDDGLNIEDYVPVAPLQAEYLYNELIGFVDRIQNEDIKKIVSYIIEMKKDKLMIYPAAMKNHHAIRSGLLYHIVSMLQVGDRITDIYTSVNRDLLFAGIMLHDIAKLDEMDANELGLVSDYTLEGQLLGHITQGIVLIDNVTNLLGTDSETALLLKHMILTHHYEPEYGSPKKPLIPEAELLHYIDMIDARMFDMEKALCNVAPSQFSEKIWTLDNRKLYKSKLKSV